LASVKVPKKAVGHIVERHGDWVQMLGLKSAAEVQVFLSQVVSQPDEAYADRFRSGVKYFLKHLEELGGKLLCVVVVGDEVVTAYLINREKYSKYRARRWA
jgi:hypothetical protein